VIKILAKIKKAVKGAKTALIAGHIDPDGDAIGSMLALGMMLEKIGLTVTLFNADGVPKIYKFLPRAERIRSEIFPRDRFDIAFVVDSSDLCRVGDKFDLRQAAPVIINIDHHPDNTLFGDINYVMKTSSVAEEVYDVIKYFKVKPDRNIADCLYTAMITDTGNFRYENTSVKTFHIAAELIKAGVNTHELTTRIYDTRSIASLRILGAALSTLKFSADKKAAWTAVTEEMMKTTGARGEDLIGLVDQIRSIDEVEVAVLFRQEKGKVKINFRSKKKANVSEIASRFGGGGHTKAAGAIVEGPLAKVEEKVMAEVTKYLEASKYLV
jgi:phosphoesterase RecJ-like protein